MEITNNLRGLFNQFCKAYGIKIVNENDQTLIRTFFEWLSEEKREKDDFYRSLLGQMGLNINSTKTVEVGKTITDTIVLPYRTKIVTPYDDGFENYKGRVTIANLKFYGNFPSFVQEREHATHAIPCDMFDKFITQNPYTNKEIADWYKFPFQDIIVGAYGDVNDADRKNKMRQLNELYKKLDPSLNPRKEHVIDGYNYATVVSTHRR